MLFSFIRLMENQFCCRVDRSSLGEYHQINFTIFHLWLYLLVMLVALSRLATTCILDYFHMLYVLRGSILHLDTCHYIGLWAPVDCLYWEWTSLRHLGDDIVDLAWLLPSCLPSPVIENIKWILWCPSIFARIPCNWGHVFNKCI